MSADAAALRRTAVAAEREWARQGWPDQAFGDLAWGCCDVAFWNGSVKDMRVCQDVAGPECKPDYLDAVGADWSARILWLYVVAHAIEEGCL